MEKINPKEFYKPAEIAELGLFPWTKREKSIREWLLFSYNNGNKYRIVMKSANGNVDAAVAKHGIRWFVPGRSIIKIIADFESGKLFKGK